MLQRLSGGRDADTPLPTHITVDFVYDLEGLYAVRKEWLALENRASDPLTYFQSFDWCEKWCRIFAPDALKRGGSIHIALIRAHGQLAAVLPLAIESRKGLALVLRFIGEPMIQYSKALMDEAIITRHELRLCLDRVTAKAKCDAVWLDHLVQDSPLHACLHADECYQSPGAYASAINLKPYDNMAAYRATLSRASRKGRNKKRRKLQALGKLTFHSIDGHDPRFHDFCGIALLQKQTWLEASGLPTARLEDERMLRMLGELGVDTGSNSGVIAFALCLDDNPIALEIGFWRRDHYYSYLGSYDWEMREYSPGKLLMEDAIGWTIENGFSTYDLLGNPSEYKEALADTRIPLVAYAHGKTLAGSAYARLWRPKVKPSIKQTIASMPLALRQGVFILAGRGSTK